MPPSGLARRKKWHCAGLATAQGAFNGRAMLVSSGAIDPELF